MKKLIFILLLFFTSVSAQNQKVIVVSNLFFDGGSSVPQLDSLTKEINGINDASLVVFTGSLTTKGTKQQFESLHQSLSRLKINYVLLPFGSDCREFDGWNKFLELWNDDKFIINTTNNVFIGINPTLHYTQLNFYSQELIDWLSAALDEINLNKEIYFFAPIEIEKITGWQTVLNLLSKKNIKLVVCGNAQKFQLRNLYGFNILDIQSSFIKINENLNYALLEITNNNIILTDKSTNKTLQLDKSIFITKEKIELSTFTNINCTVEANIQNNQNMYAEPIWWNSKIYAASQSGIISCYDSTGKILWDFDSFGDIIGTPVIEDRIFAAATLQGDIVTLSAISGEQIQSIGFEESITTALMPIKYNGEKELMIPKLTKSNTAIVFGTSSGKLFCYDLETLQEYWSNVSSKGMIKSKPVSVNNKILFTSNDGFIYCIDARNGLLIWRWKEKAETDFFESKLETNGRFVYSVSNDGIVYSIDLLLGKMNWKIDNINAKFSFSLSADKKNLFVKSNNGKIYSINADKGKIINEYKINDTFDNSYSDILELNGALLFSNNGVIQTIDSKSRNDNLIFVDYSPSVAITKIGYKKFIAATYNGNIVTFILR